MEQLSKTEQAISKLMEQVGGAFSSPTTLSQIMVRLAYLNHFIGRHLAQLQADYRVKRKEIFDQFTTEGHKVTRAKEEAEAAAREEEQRYDHFYNLHTDTNTFINVCQSHLRTLGMEAKNQL